MTMMNLDTLPPKVTKALAEKAAHEGRTVEEVAGEAIARGLGVNGAKNDQRDFSRYVGTWVEDPAFDEAMKDFDRTDPEDGD